LFKAESWGIIRARVRQGYGQCLVKYSDHYITLYFPAQLQPPLPLGSKQPIYGLRAI
jgi:hypothetical protein